MSKAKLNGIPRRSIEHNGVKLTLQRRTNLSEARYHAILAKCFLFYKELASDLQANEDDMNIALTTWARIASQSTTEHEILPKATDTSDELQVKARRWLLEVDPEFSNRLHDAALELNRTWSDPAVAPEPLPVDADPN